MSLHTAGENIWVIKFKETSIRYVTGCSSFLLMDKMLLNTSSGKRRFLHYFYYAKAITVYCTNTHMTAKIKSVTTVMAERAEETCSLSSGLSAKMGTT